MPPVEVQICLKGTCVGAVKGLPISLFDDLTPV